MKEGKEEEKGQEGKDYATKGWNWGNVDCNEGQLNFKVANKPCFSVPYTEIASANMTDKNEIILEFHQDDTAKDQ